MKGWVIGILAVIGGYAVYQWVVGQRATPAGNRTAAAAGVTLGPLGVAVGIQSNIDPTTAGVPTFNQLPIANGHGDQVWAAYHNNPYSSIPGQAQYSPAFGPNENQVNPNTEAAITV
jgi:hypothetical protein